jgi:hypothetical protein
MAIHKGSEGTVKVGSDAIAEIRSYSIEETAATIESTTMGDTARSYESSLTDGTGTIDVYWDETDTAQNALTIGASVTVNFYPEGDTAGDTYYTGTALVTGITRTGAFDGLVEATINVQFTGGISSTTV